METLHLTVLSPPQILCRGSHTAGSDSPGLPFGQVTQDQDVSSCAVWTKQDLRVKQAVCCPPPGHCHLPWNTEHPSTLHSLPSHSCLHIRSPRHKSLLLASVSSFVCEGIKPGAAWFCRQVTIPGDVSWSLPETRRQCRHLSEACLPPAEFHLFCTFAREGNI